MKSAIKKPRKTGGLKYVDVYDSHGNFIEQKPEFSLIDKVSNFVFDKLVKPIVFGTEKSRQKRKEKYQQYLENKDNYGYDPKRGYGKKTGGKAMKDMTAAELQALDDARTANAIWAKSKAGKEYKANLADLTNKEKLSQARNTARQWKKDVYDPKKAQMEETQAQQIERRDQEASRKKLGEEVDFQKEQRRLQAEAAANKKKSSLWDDIANVAIGEVVNLLPVPKVAKDIVKQGAKEGYNALRGGNRHMVQKRGGKRGGSQGGEQKTKVGMSLKATIRQPLVNQHPELEGNKLLDKILTNSVFMKSQSLLKNGMRQELAYPPFNMAFGEGKKTGSRKFIK